MLGAARSAVLARASLLGTLTFEGCLEVGLSSDVSRLSVDDLVLVSLLDVLKPELCDRVCLLAMLSDRPKPISPAGPFTLLVRLCTATRAIGALRLLMPFASAAEEEPGTLTEPDLWSPKFDAAASGLRCSFTMVEVVLLIEDG